MNKWKELNRKLKRLNNKRYFMQYKLKKKQKSKHLEVYKRSVKSSNKKYNKLEYNY